MLRRHPLLLAEWLAARNLLQRAKAHAAAVLGVAFVVLGALTSILLTFAQRLAAVFDSLLSYRMLVAALIAIYAAFVVAGRRQRSEGRYTQFWLAAAPIPQYNRTLAILVVTLMPLAGQLFAVFVLIAAVGIAGGVAATLVGQAMLWVAVATVVGAAVGWWSARRSRADALEGSRYVGAVKPRKESTPSAAALSGWPLAQVRAWGRPENLRILVLIPALFAVQAGSSALHGLSVIAIWVVGGYLGGLLAAVSQTARSASHWLRSTPLPFAQFAWALTRKALLYQLVWTAIGVALLIGLGAPIVSALYVSALWLAIVVLSCSIAVADAYRQRPPLARMVLSFATLAVIEARTYGWSIPVAALLAAWHLRAGAKA
ncbi:MAG TPA: hypothetical protein VFO35_06655 [Steroidobacteraceae bacterium]|nr:hypothetical protein [Steroidobacteraceae bacterium]